MIRAKSKQHQPAFFATKKKKNLIINTRKERKILINTRRSGPPKDRTQTFKSKVQVKKKV